MIQHVPEVLEGSWWSAVVAVEDLLGTTATGGIKIPGGGTRSPLPQPEEKPEEGACEASNVGTVTGDDITEDGFQ